MRDLGEIEFSHHIHQKPFNPQSNILLPLIKSDPLINASFFAHLVYKLINFYIDEPTGGSPDERPLVKRLLSHQPYLDTYHGYLEEFLDGPFNIDRMSLRIDETAKLVRPFVTADELKFFTNEEFERGLDKDLKPVTTQQRFMPGALIKVMGLKTFIMERTESIRKQLDGNRKSRPDDGSGNGGAFGFPGFLKKCSGKTDSVK